MKRLYLAVAAAALIQPAFALGPDKDKSSDGMKAEWQESSETAVETDANAQATMKTGASADAMAQNDAAMDNEARVHLAADSVGVKEILGTPILNAAGERIGRVDDLRLNANGSADQLIFLSGGVFGFGGKKGAIAFNEVSLDVADEHDPTVSVSFSERNMKSAAAYEQDKSNDFWMASELIGASAELSAGDDDASISDLIVKKTGAVEYAVVQNGLLGSLGGEKRAVAFNEISIEQGAGGVAIDLTPDELAAEPVFDYRRTSDIAEDSMETEKIKDTQNTPVKQ